MITNKIENYFPDKMTPRKVQTKLLKEIENCWDYNDVICIDADVGFGKSAVLQTIAKWRAEKGESTATMTPRVSLQNQYKKSFPEVTVLQGKSRYKCNDTIFKNCLEKKEVTGEHCSGCKYKCDRDTAAETNNAVFSIHSYLMLRARKDNLCFDEGHSLYDIMAEQNTIKLWHHKVKYPSNMSNYGDVIIWLEKAIKINELELTKFENHIENMKELGAEYKDMIAWVTGLKEIEQLNKKYQRVLKGIKASPTDYFIEHIVEDYRGNPCKALQIRPTTLEGSMEWVWPRPGTKKIVLASGTLSELDIQKLGLAKMRVKWIKGDKAIDSKYRPIVIEPAGNMSYKYRAKSMPLIAKKIKELRARHQNTKGLVHATYAVSKELKKFLGEEGIIYHTPKDKEEAIQKFKKAPPGTIIIASGMSMGLDLSGPTFGYQILTRVPWPSKADKLIAYWYDNDFNWISWLTLRDIIQACGRVNRYNGDYAVTYLIDNNFGNPAKNRRGFLTQFKKLIPQEFIERIQI